MAADPLWLALDVAEYLHKIADAYYDGDVEMAMNACIRAVMAAEQAPNDPWAGISQQAASRAPRRHPRE